MATLIDLNSPQMVTKIKVPDAELRVLQILQALGEAHAPAVARASNGTISVAAIYELLGRLENRGLVLKREELVPIGDITARRVFYSVHGSVGCIKSNSCST